MSDHHRCARCGVADENVRQTYELLDGNFAAEHKPEIGGGCLAALQRERERARELLREAYPLVKDEMSAQDLARRIEDALK